MKVVVAMDSFKGSVTSLEAGNAVKQGILKANHQIQVCVKPLADGGEGTAIALGGTVLSGEFTGPLGKKIHASYGILADGTAVIEMAEAAGITRLSDSERNPWHTTTFGVGEMILDAIKKGSRKFIVGIGGSATNDAGIGMLQALGYSFLDENGCEVAYGASGLSRVAQIKTDNVITQISECSFLVACDVENPLCGENGATFVYGPQKGVLEEDKIAIDSAMKNFAQKTEKFCGQSFRDTKGAGAAGGMGFAFLAFLQGSLKPGIQLVMEAVGLEEEIKTADYVVTGEGRMDAQSAMGKAPIGVAALAKKYGVKVIALTGSLGEGVEECNQKGIDAYFSIIPRIMALNEAMKKENTVVNIANISEQIFRLH